MADLKTFHLDAAAERGFGYAQAVSDGRNLHVAGTLSLDDSFAPVHAGDMAGQLRQAYGRIARTLAAHGADFSRVVRETLYVTDMGALLAANGVRLETYGSHTPAATVVEVRSLAFPPCMVEIELTAVLA